VKFYNDYVTNETMLTETVGVERVPRQVSCGHQSRVTAVQRPIWSERRRHSRGKHTAFHTT